MTRVIYLTNQLQVVAINQGKSKCYACGKKFTAKLKKIVARGHGKHSKWYHLSCAKKKNVI